ncbi:MAG TPA: DNA topoisomerase IB [Actinomycetota bacterium]|nr:DNA topoisomerase IB [Actinomycetota bacterium]
MRIRRVDCSGPGIMRRRRGRGFEYVYGSGEKVRDPETLARIRALVVPPAWEDVWICPWPNGHIQAIGVDAAGRRQYIYHSAWRERRDQEKFEHMLEFARALPHMRQHWATDLRRRDISQEKVLACAARLLDRGFFRIGTEGYAEQNQTYGLATMQKRHVTVSGETITFDYIAKSGKHRVQSVVDPDVAKIVAQLKRRSAGGPELLAYKSGTRWVDIRSADINDYIRSTGGEFTAKDFRTWNATVLAAVALSVSAEAIRSQTAGKRAMTRAVQEVAHYLGNTPAVCRASYIDPRVFDRFRSGWTIAGALESLGAVNLAGEPSLQGAIEEAVLDLLQDNRSSDALEKTA